MATITPRHLSDAVMADYDEIVRGDFAAETRAIDRWGVARSVSGWVAAGSLFVAAIILLLSVTTGSLVAWILLLLMFLAGPLLFIPAFVVWLVSAGTASRLEQSLASKMFALYGITIDRAVEPPVYTIGALPVSWLKPELHRTRTLLAADPAAEEK